MSASSLLEYLITWEKNQSISEYSYFILEPKKKIY